MRSFRFPKPEWLAFLVLACASPEPLIPVEDGRLVMGTILDVALVVSPDDEETARGEVAAAFSSASSLEAVASSWLRDSQVSELNRLAGQGGVLVDPRLRSLLERAEEARRFTGGAFDCSVGPLLAVWNRDAPPDESEVRHARSLVGAPIRFEADGTVSLAAVGMSIDLGGIAKGYALDEIAVRLRKAGLARGLLSFGESSVWALGVPPDAPRWRLAVRDESGAPATIVELADQALSVSSSQGGHVVNPASGMRVSSGRRAIVVARDATLAEVLSTTLLVLPEQEGRTLVKEQGAEAKVESKSGASWHTAGWAQIQPD